jgi:competence protein ComEC
MIEGFFSILILKYTNFWIGIFINFLISITLGFVYKKNKIIICVIPLLLCIRFYTFVNLNDYQVNDEIKIELLLIEGKGKIEKINDKVPYMKSYGNISYLRDGKYRISGKILKKTERYGIINYVIEKNENKNKIQEIEKNIIEKYFFAKAEKFIEKCSIDFKNMYMAVVLGDNSRLSRNMRELFSYTGTSHLLALSGLHIGIIFSVMLAIAKKIPIKKEKKYFLILISITIYFLGVKNSPSLTRAYTMVLVSLMGKLCYENVDTEKSLTFSFFVSMFLNPLTMEEPSLRLSYFAAFAIIFIVPIIKKYLYTGKSKLLNFVILSGTIQLFLTPIIAYDFGKIPFLSFFTNMIIMPIGSIYITIAFLGLMLENIGLGFTILYFLEIIYNIFYKMLLIFNKIPYLTIESDMEIPLLPVVGFYVVIFISVFYLKYKNENQ